MKVTCIQDIFFFIVLNKIRFMNVLRVIQFLLQTDASLSPIGEMSMTGEQQAYTSEFFNSILGATNATVATFNVTDRGGMPFCFIPC